MARYIGPKCKLSRRVGTDLLLKSRGRSLETKCKLDTPPGQHGARKPRLSDYALQLREKQKLKQMYGLLERQFRNYYVKATKSKGATGLVLLRMLEQRLDNVVYRMGLATSRAAARQLVRHGHIDVAGRRVDIPSYQVSPGQEIAVRERSRKMATVQRALDFAGSRTVPAWLTMEREAMKGHVVSLPKRDDVNFPIQEQMIVELYSK